MPPTGTGFPLAAASSAAGPPTVNAAAFAPNSTLTLPLSSIWAICCAVPSWPAINTPSIFGRRRAASAKLASTSSAATATVTAFQDLNIPVSLNCTKNLRYSALAFATLQFLLGVQLVALNCHVGGGRLPLRLLAFNFGLLQSRIDHLRHGLSIGFLGLGLGLGDVGLLFLQRHLLHLLLFLFLGGIRLLDLVEQRLRQRHEIENLRRDRDAGLNHQRQKRLQHDPGLFLLVRG